VRKAILASHNGCSSLDKRQTELNFATHHLIIYHQNDIKKAQNVAERDRRLEGGMGHLVAEGSPPRGDPSWKMWLRP
jgi:hypothetical protein